MDPDSWVSWFLIVDVLRIMKVRIRDREIGVGPEGMKRRTKLMALRSLKLSEALPRNQIGKVLGHQLIRSSTSVAANYRAAQMARSKREFISKLSIAIEECDESGFWLEMVIESGQLPKGRVQGLLDEIREVLSILVTARKTARLTQ
jgi:four helix bundle protein